MKVHQVIVYAASLMLLSSAVRGDVSAEAPLVDADDLASEVANIRSTPPKDEDFMPSSGRELDTDMEMDSMGEEPGMTPTLPRPSRRRTSWNSGRKKPSWKKQHWNKQWGWKKDPWWKSGWKKDSWWNKPAWGHNNWWDSKPSSWKKPSWNDDYYWNKPSWGRGRKGPRKNKNLFHRRDQELNLWASPSNDETDYDDEGGNY